MRGSCNTLTTRQGAHDNALGSWAFAGLLRGAGAVARYLALVVSLAVIIGQRPS